MQRVTLVRYRVKPDRLAENEVLSRAVFAELRATAPKHVTYALFKHGREFVHLFVNLQGDDSDAVTSLASFQAYTKDIAARCETPVDATRLSLDLLESYGLPEAR